MFCCSPDTDPVCSVVFPDTDPVVITGEYLPFTEANNPGQTYPQNTTCGDKNNSVISVHW